MQLLACLAAAESAAAVGDWPAVKEAADRCLQEGCRPVAEHAELGTRLLVLKGKALLQLQEHDAALQVLDTALLLEPTCCDALWLRSAAHTAAGHHMARFMDLRRLSEQRPTFPGLQEALQQAAQAVMEQRASTVPATPPGRKTYVHLRRSGAASSNANTGPNAPSRTRAYAVLGLQVGASFQDVRKAYKQLAAQHHPDKWVAAGPAAQETAAEAFKQIAAAYQSILHDAAGRAH